MKFREYLNEMDVNPRHKKVQPKHKELELELKKLRTSDENFSVLNDTRGKFTLTYKIQKDDEKAVKKLADKGFKILKKYYPKAKEVKSKYDSFPYEPTGYYLEIEYKLGE